MKSIGKQAAEFLRKAASALRRKAAVLRARLLFLASPRRRMALVAGISRQIRALTPRQEKTAAAQCRGTAVAPPADEDRAAVSLPELARLFEQVAADEGGGYPDDWALTLRSLFDDEGNGGGFAVVDGLDADDEDGDDEPSVMDVIRSRRERDGSGEFRMEDAIDEAADMYIARVRRRIINCAQTELKLSTLISNSQSHSSRHAEI
ncbi:unnamed protein product [Urochloa decumbens]|uniref:Uncharacterized protein n=1 Tax=Urochloa decumbens TaxID=240449 RepID=A0ABC9C5D4_9POAL